jgi:phage shock protein E
MKFVLLALVAAALFFLVHSRGAGAQESEDVLRALVQESNALLLDVRTPGEFSSGHMTGAVNLPLDRIQSLAQIETTLDREIVLYCRSGARSARAAQVLRSQGYTRVHDLGPMRRW